MRFLDFIQDIQETSSRIAQRDAHAYETLDVAVGLTVKTLLRPDVIAYFDSMKAEGEHVLSGAQSLIFYVTMYAYAVNVRPRPNHADMSDFGVRVLKRLSGMDILTEKGHIFCESGKIKLPQRVKNALHSVFKTYHRSGLFCQYSTKVPDAAQIQALCDSRFKDASLLLYTGSAGIFPEVMSERVVYSGNIFTSKTYILSGVYIQSLL